MATISSDPFETYSREGRIPTEVIKDVDALSDDDEDEIHSLKTAAILDIAADGQLDERGSTLLYAELASVFIRHLRLLSRSTATRPGRYPTGGSLIMTSENHTSSERAAALEIAAPVIPADYRAAALVPASVVCELETIDDQQMLEETLTDIEVDHDPSARAAYHRGRIAMNFASCFYDGGLLGAEHTESIEQLLRAQLGASRAGSEV